MHTTDKMLYHSTQEAIAVVERMLEATTDKTIRNHLARRLAVFDREVAALRDKAQVGNN